jgi:ferredoxin/flavodoxin---NADP+ reductase
MGRAIAYNATLVGRTDLTDALATFLIQADQLPRTRPWFVAGQYCVLGLNNHEAPALGAVRRAMSIVSAPEVDGPLEFYVRYVARPTSPNPLTHLLWKLKVGDRMYLRTSAAGQFTIDHTVGTQESRLRVMVAAGTGVAPFISMIRSELWRNPAVDLSNWVLLHGASYPNELGYREELLARSASNGLKYCCTVSRAGEMREWRGNAGRVESFFESQRLLDLEHQLGLPAGGLTPDNAVVFICGLTGTIREVLVRLIDRGFVAHAKAVRDALGVPPEARASVFYELYDPTPIIDIDDPAVMEPLRARMLAALARRERYL